MDTLSDKLKKSRKEWSDQGMRLFADTKEAGKGFVNFMHGEAREWGEYFREQYKELENQGREILRPATDKEQLKAQLDTILAKIMRREQEAAIQGEPADADGETEEAAPQAEA